MKHKMYILCGLPGSGKSTWLEYRTFSNEIVLCPDEFRKTITGQDYYAPLDEIVWFCVKNAARVLIKQVDLIIDATSLSKGSRSQWIRIAQEAGVQVWCYYFDTPLELCKERIEKRERVVPDEVMERMVNQFEYPTLDEGFEEILNIGP